MIYSISIIASFAKNKHFWDIYIWDFINNEKYDNAVTSRYGKVYEKNKLPNGAFICYCEKMQIKINVFWKNTFKLI